MVASLKALQGQLAYYVNSIMFRSSLHWPQTVTKAIHDCKRYSSDARYFWLYALPFKFQQPNYPARQINRIGAVVQWHLRVRGADAVL